MDTWAPGPTPTELMDTEREAMRRRVRGMATVRVPVTDTAHDPVTATARVLVTVTARGLARAWLRGDTGRADTALAEDMPLAADER